MMKLKRLLAAATLAAVASLGAAPAYAATPAGSTIKNDVTVNYKVGTVSQTAIQASDSFTVDRKVNLTVIRENQPTSVTPGSTNQVSSFLVSNLTNAPIDIGLVASNLGGDGYDVSNFRIYLDANNDGTLSAAESTTAITYLDQVAAETSNIRVFVVADVPLTATNTQAANIRLTGTAAEATAAGTLGAVITNSSVNTAGMDTVLADGRTAVGNTAYDGVDFDQATYTVLSATVSVVKSSRIVSDPVNLTTNPKAIPGATIEYCIAVSNSGGTSASDVAISDTLPSATTYEPTFGVKVNGTMTGSTCNPDGGVAGAHASGTVSGTIPTVAAGATRTVLFRVLIN